MILGDLEKTVLRYFWEIDAADAKQVHAHFEKIRGGSLNTIQATLDRLFKKGLLHRSKQSHAFIYESAMDKHTFLGKLIVDVTRDFSENNENPLASAFTSIASTSSEKDLEELERLISHQRKIQQKGESE